MRTLTASIVTLNHLSAADEARAGAKASNCARLRQAGFPVPDGLVLLSNAIDADAAEIASTPGLRFVTHDCPAGGSELVKDRGVRQA